MRARWSAVAYGLEDTGEARGGRVDLGIAHVGDGAGGERGAQPPGQGERRYPAGEGGAEHGTGVVQVVSGRCDGDQVGVRGHTLDLRGELLTQRGSPGVVEDRCSRRAGDRPPAKELPNATICAYDTAGVTSSGTDIPELVDQRLAVGRFRLGLWVQLAANDRPLRTDSVGGGRAMPAVSFTTTGTTRRNVLRAGRRR